QQKLRDELQGKIAALEKRMKSLENVTPEILAKWEDHLTAEQKEMFPKKVRDILALPPNGRSAKQEEEVLTAYRNLDSVKHAVGGLGLNQNFLMAAHANALTMRSSLEKQIIELKAQVPAIPTTMVVRERPTPRVTNIMLGGDFIRKGAVVQPGTPSVLPELKAAKPNRLDLARWLVDGRNPLTARV